MKSKRMLATLLTVSLTASMALVGCGSEKNQSASAEADNGGKDAEQYLNVTAMEPKTLDVSKASDSYSATVLNQCMDALTRMETKDGKEVVVPAMAESWTTSEDGLKWTFKLRDAKWSDGKPVTADQFVYSFKRTLDAKTASPYAFLLFPIKNAQEANAGKISLDEIGVKATDEKTLEIELKSPCAYFLQLTYFKVMEPQREDIIKQHGDRYGSEADTLVFNGPFKVTNWTHNNKIEFEKNDQYWDKDKVSLDKLTFKIIKEDPSRMNELYNGSLDVAQVTKPEWVKKFDETKRFNVIKTYDGATTYEFFNTKDKYFANDKIRKAFMLAKDREGNVTTLFKGLAEPAYAWCPPAIQVGEETFRSKSEDFVKKLAEENKDPKALLIEGLKEIGEDPDPSKHTFKYLDGGTSATNKEFADFAQQNYKKVLGVNIEPELVEWPVFQDKTKKLEYQIASMGWTGDYNDPMTFFDMFVSGAGVVDNGWSSEEYDTLIQKAQNTMDQNERAKLFKQAEELLLYKEGVISPGVYRMRNTYAAKYAKDIMYPMFGSTTYKYAYTSGRK
ncbi:MAG: peptide ABC transporter substrate-binding protein [Clostridium sp.]